MTPWCCLCDAAAPASTSLCVYGAQRRVLTASMTPPARPPRRRRPRRSPPSIGACAAAGGAGVVRSNHCAFCSLAQESIKAKEAHAQQIKAVSSLVTFVTLALIVCTLFSVSGAAARPPSQGVTCANSRQPTPVLPVATAVIRTSSHNSRLIRERYRPRLEHHYPARPQTNRGQLASKTG